jgi:sec-independent protein translocase protein TatA
MSPACTVSEEDLMGLGWQHILIFGVIVLLLFGRGKISELMGDVAKGIKAFKKGMTEEEPKPESEAQATTAPKAIEHRDGQPVAQNAAVPERKAS